MRHVARIQTSDGELHETARDASRHAEKRYGDALTRLAHKALRCEKYTQMLEFIDQNLDEFVALKALKNDMVLEQPDPDDME